MRSLETEEKVRLLRFKTSFGKVRNGWSADNIDVKISFTRKLKIPEFFFFKTKVPFLNFWPKRQNGNNFAFCSTENECRNLVFLLILTSRVGLNVRKKVALPESFADSIRLLQGLQKHRMSEDCFRGRRRSYHHMRRN